LNRYEIILKTSAIKMLKDIPDRRIQRKLLDAIHALEQEPEKQGKALTGELEGYRALRAIGQRYRILYRVERNQIIVIVFAIGIRKEGDKKDIYSLAKKLVKAGLLKD